MEGVAATGWTEGERKKKEEDGGRISVQTLSRFIDKKTPSIIFRKARSLLYETVRRKALPVIIII